MNNLKIFSKEAYSNLEVIRINLQEVDCQINSNLNEQFDLAIKNLKADGLDINSAANLGDDDNPKGSVFGGLGLGGLTTGALIAFTGLGFLPVLLAGGAAALIGSFFGTGIDEESAKMNIKQQVCDASLKNFHQSAEEIFNRICENITEVFSNDFESFSRVIEQAISLYENLLEQQEKAHQETQEKIESEKVFISDKQQQLKQLQNQLEIILSQINKSR